jgi:hypothetical protein
VGFLFFVRVPVHNYEHFAFDLDRVLEFADSRVSTREKIFYLEWVMTRFWSWWLTPGNHPELFELSHTDKMLDIGRLIEEKIKYLKVVRLPQEKMDHRLSVNSIAHKEKSADKSGAPREKLKWMGTEAQIINLFELLFKEDLITEAQYLKRYSLISGHFVNKDGNPFKNKQLAQSAQNSRGAKSKGMDQIEEIVDRVSKPR